MTGTLNFFEFAEEAKRKDNKKVNVSLVLKTSSSVEMM